MNEYLQRTTNSIAIAEFWENEQLKKYNYEPPYQRLSVWSEEKQSFFIDSLLRNYPVPPIFLHKKIDDSTGKQTFNIIDGKQRLTSIKRFINNEISAISDNVEDKLSGIYFDDLDKLDSGKYKKLFWRYELQIQYIDTEDERIIDSLFDRLNRNGEKLNGQELRQAKYHDSNLLNLVDELSNINFLKKLTENYDLLRMEDKEFISELLFETIENKPLSANQKILDDYYVKYKDIEVLVNKENFIKTLDFFEGLNLNFQQYAIAGVSHIYGLWCFSHYCVNENITNIQIIKDRIDLFYNEQKKPLKEITNSFVKDYKQSMSANTKSYSQRNKRVEALKKYIFKNHYDT